MRNSKQNPPGPAHRPDDRAHPHLRHEGGKAPPSSWRNDHRLAREAILLRKGIYVMAEYIEAGLPSPTAMMPEEASIAVEC